MLKVNSICALRIFKPKKKNEYQSYFGKLAMVKFAEWYILKSILQASTVNCFYIIV